MKRGDVILIQEPGTPASKARPCVVVQRESGLAQATKITVCPMTSRLRGAQGQRPFVAPTQHNGLTKPSEVQVDWIYTHPREFLGPRIGALDTATLEQVDMALRRWLNL
jgi:mRNA interferase MazF